MVTLTQNPFFIPAIPFVSFALNLFWGKRLGKASALLSILASAAAALLSVPFTLTVMQGNIVQGNFAWLRVGAGELFFGWRLDPLSAPVLMVASFVGTLIQIYSAGYMHGDKRFPRFFAYMSLFMSAMLMLVIADNYILFFIAWEMMGLCSYLLIGFWFEKASAAQAAKKAFLTTRIGDIGLFLGILMLFGICGSFNFSELAPALHSVHSPLLFLAALLVFCGTLGKSAQFPLYIWLPDAMEGPTPVSALIHAATMVAAGVYLMIRSFPLLEAGHALPMIALTGTLTAFFTACLALRAWDIKRILAYSTISQLGFMTAAVGLGSPTAAMFHLLTHAFFKALLFMGAGSVIHACGTQDIRDLGGLSKKMRSTTWTFLLGAAALAGIPPFSGFWSKDDILSAAASQTTLPVVYPALLITAFLTALYTFRLFFLTFMGNSRASNQKTPHESPASMTLPLWILGILALIAGFPGSPWMGRVLQRFWGTPEHLHTESAAAAVMLASALVSFAGALFAEWLYLKPGYALKRSTNSTDSRLNQVFGKLLAPFGLLDTTLNTLASGSARGTALIAKASDFADRYLVDNFVNFTGVMSLLSSAVLRQIQTGFIQNYLLIAFTGLVTLLVLGLR